MVEDPQDLFRPARPNQELFTSGRQIEKRRERPVVNKVAESIARINSKTDGFKPGWYGAIRLSPYQQQDSTTCFFSGPISVARDFRGVLIPEHPLAAKARQLGLLNEYGAVTTEEDKTIALEEFVQQETGVTIGFHPHSYGDQEEDLKVLDILVERGNLALVLYPLSDSRHEWETFFGVTKVAGEEGVRWYSNFSPRGTILERITPQMAELLYGKPRNPYLLICEIQIQTFLESRSPLFGPAGS